MKKSIAILTAIIILVAAVVAASVIIALKQQDAPPVDTSADTTPTEPEKEEMKFYYTSGDAVAGTLAALPDKNIDSLLEKLGEDCTVISEELMRWNFDLCKAYICISKEEYQEMLYKFSSNLSDLLPYGYSDSMLCWRYIVSVNGDNYIVYSTVKTREELELNESFSYYIDENTYDTVFRIVKHDGSTKPLLHRFSLYEPEGVVFHAPEFKFTIEVLGRKNV